MDLRRDSHRLQKGFSLPELIVVISVLGILAAVLLPALSSGRDIAMEAVAKDNLRILRTAIECYAAQHNDVPPGYDDGRIGLNLPDEDLFIAQLCLATNSLGETAPRGTPGFPYGPYLVEMACNPFNHEWSVKTVDFFPVIPAGTHGWYYNGPAKEIRLDWPGIDTSGVTYYSY